MKRSRTMRRLGRTTVFAAARGAATAAGSAVVGLLLYWVTHR